MPAIKKTVSLSEELVKAVNTITPNFSAVVETALIEYLAHYRIEKAMESFGKWDERKESSVKLVNELREEHKRNHANRTDRH